LRGLFYEAIYIDEIKCVQVNKQEEKVGTK